MKAKLTLLLSCFLFTGIGLAAAEPQPPKGYRALFNGKDLSGWWGLKTEDPSKWMALPPEQLAAKKKKSLEDIAKHWRVEGDELVNDGKGLYLST